MKKVANIVFNSFTNDSRVIKEPTILVNNNCHYTIKNIYNWEEQEKILIDIYQGLDL